MDEARFGQQGTLTRVWTPKGSRPTAVKQTRHEWVHLYAAVEPAMGASVALRPPHANIRTMADFVGMLADELAEGDHAIVVMDRAGWHVSKALEVQARITILPLPTCSPKLNPIERLFGCLRSHHLTDRAYKNYRYLLHAGAEAWRNLTLAMLCSACV